MAHISIDPEESEARLVELVRGHYIANRVHDEFILIPRREVDEIAIKEADGLLEAGGGPEVVRGNLRDNPAWHRNAAIHSLAIASRIEEGA